MEESQQSLMHCSYDLGEPDENSTLVGSACSFTLSTGDFNLTSTGTSNESANNNHNSNHHFTATNVSTPSTITTNTNSTPSTTIAAAAGAVRANSLSNSLPSDAAVHGVMSTNNTIATTSTTSTGDEAVVGSQVGTTAQGMGAGNYSVASGTTGTGTTSGESDAATAATDAAHAAMNSTSFCAMSESAGDHTAMSSLSASTCSTMSGISGMSSVVPNHQRRLNSHHLLDTPIEEEYEEDSGHRNNNNNNNNSASIHSDSGNHSDSSISGKRMMERKLRRQLSLSRRKLSSRNHSDGNLSLSMSDLQFNAQQNQQQQQEEQAQQQESATAKGTSGGSGSRRQQFLHRAHHSMPASDFTLTFVDDNHRIPLDTSSGNEDDNININNEKDLDGSGETSLVSLSGRNLLQKQHRRNTVDLMRRRSKRDLLYSEYEEEEEEDHHKEDPNNQPSQVQVPAATHSSSTGNTTTGAIATDFRNRRSPTNHHHDDGDGKIPASSRNNNDMDSSMKDNSAQSYSTHSNDDESTVLSPIRAAPRRASSDRTASRTGREMRVPKRTLSAVSEMTMSDDSGYTYGSRRGLSAVSEVDSGHFSVSTSMSFKQQQQMQQNCRLPRRSLSGPRWTTSSRDDSDLHRQYQRNSTLSAVSEATPDSHFSVTTTPSFRQYQQQQQQQQESQPQPWMSPPTATPGTVKVGGLTPKAPQRTASSAAPRPPQRSESNTGGQRSEFTTAGGQAPKPPQRSVSGQAPKFPQRSVSAMTRKSEATSTHFSVGTSESFQQYQEEFMDQSQQRNCRVPRRTMSASSIMSMSTIGNHSVTSMSLESGVVQDDEQTVSPLQGPTEKVGTRSIAKSNNNPIYKHRSLLALPLVEGLDDDNHDEDGGGNNGEDNNDDATTSSGKLSLSGQKLLEKKRRQEQQRQALLQRHNSNVQAATISRRNMLQKARSVSYLSQASYGSGWSSLEDRLRALPSSSKNKEQAIQLKQQHHYQERGRVPVLEDADFVGKTSRRASASGRQPGCTRSLSPMKSESSRWITGCFDGLDAFTLDDDNKSSIDDGGDGGGGGDGQWRLASSALDEKTLLFQRSTCHGATEKEDRNLGVAPCAKKEAVIQKSNSTPNLLALDASESDFAEFSEESETMGTAVADTPRKTKIDAAKIDSILSFLLGEGVAKKVKTTATDKPTLNEALVNPIDDDEASTIITDGDSILFRPPPKNGFENMVVRKAAPFFKTDKNDTFNTSFDSAGEGQSANASSAAVGWSIENEDFGTKNSEAPAATDNSIAENSEECGGEKSNHTHGTCTDSVDTPVLAAIEENFESFHGDGDEDDDDKYRDSRKLMNVFKKQLKTGTRYLRKKAQSVVGGEKDELERLSRSMSAFSEFEENVSTTGALHMEKLEELPDEDDAEEFACDSGNDKKKDMRASEHEYTKPQKVESVPRRGLLGSGLSFMRSASVPNFSLADESQKKANNKIREQTIVEKKAADEKASSKATKEQKSSAPHTSPMASPASAAPSKRRTKMTKPPSIRNLDDQSQAPTIKLSPPTGDTPKYSMVRPPSIEMLDRLDGSYAKRSSKSRKSASEGSDIPKTSMVRPPSMEMLDRLDSPHGKRSRSKSRKSSSEGIDTPQTSMVRPPSMEMMDQLHSPHGKRSKSKSRKSSSEGSESKSRSMVRPPSLEMMDQLDTSEANHSKGRKSSIGGSESKSHARRKSTSTSEKRSRSQEKRSSAHDKRSSSHEKRSSTTKKRSSSKDKRSSTAEKPSASKVKRTSTAGSRSSTTSENAVSPKLKQSTRKRDSSKEKGKSKDRRGSTTEKRSGSKERRSTTSDQKRSRSQTRREKGEKGTRSTSEDKRRRSQSTERKHRSRSSSVQRRKSGSRSLTNWHNSMATATTMESSVTTLLSSAVSTPLTSMHSRLTTASAGTMQSSVKPPPIFEEFASSSGTSDSFDAMKSYMPSSLHDKPNKKALGGLRGHSSLRSFDDESRRSASSRKSVQSARPAPMQSLLQGSPLDDSSSRASIRKAKMKLTRQAQSERHLKTSSGLAKSGREKERKGAVSPRKSRSKSATRRSSSQGPRSSSQGPRSSSQGPRQEVKDKSLKKLSASVSGSSMRRKSSSSKESASILSASRSSRPPVTGARQRMGKSQSLRHISGNQ